MSAPFRYFYVGTLHEKRFKRQRIQKPGQNNKPEIQTISNQGRHKSKWRNVAVLFHFGKRNSFKFFQSYIWLQILLKFKQRTDFEYLKLKRLFTNKSEIHGTIL